MVRWITIAITLASLSLKGQDRLFQSDTSYNRSRVIISTAGLGSFYLINTWALYNQWYKNFDSKPFHFFNDIDEWQQMDKVGHLFTSYYLADQGYHLYRWAGIERKKALLIGSGTSLLFTTTIEVFDGYSSKWGWSWGDVTSNVIGTSIFSAQEYIWEHQYVSLKYSFHSTNFPQYRKNVLGRNFTEELLKDYNGQTYWLSFNTGKFFSHKIISMLDLCLGYGATGMTGGKSNPIYNEQGQLLPSFNRYRQYYLSVDLNLKQLVKKPGLLKTFLQVFGSIKIPAPALEFRTNNKVIFHPLYF